MIDFTPITELPGSPLNQEQLARITQRYQLGAELAQSKDVLEVSCGAGMGLGILRQAACTLTACDYTYPVLAVAQQHNRGWTPLVCADAQQLPFANSAFDLVLSFEAIYYFNQLDQFLAEAHRVLRTGGQLLIGTSNPDWPHFVAGQMSVHYPGVPELAARLHRCDFHALKVYGALPTHTAATPWQRLVAAVRKRVLHQRFFASDNFVTRFLKQLAYGQLTPLPPVLASHMPASPGVYDELTPISASAPDRIHRVYFVVAEV